MRRDAIVEVIEVKPLSITDVPEVLADREEQPGSEPASRAVPVKA